MIGWYAGFCATFFGITASPGVSIEATVSSFPDPGTYVAPRANLFGDFPPNPGIIIPGFDLAKLDPAIVASI